MAGKIMALVTPLVRAIARPLVISLDGTYLGPELVVNGTFDADLSGWINGNSWWSVVSGRAFHTSSSNFNGLEQNFTGGKLVELSFDYELIGGTLGVIGGASTELFKTSVSGVNSVKIETFDLQKLRFARLDAALTEAYIDNVSVREVL